MSNPMTYKEVLDHYKSVLEKNPGKALVIGNGNYAFLENGNLFGCQDTLDGKPSASDSYDFDSSAFIEDEGRWDDDTAENLINQINAPVLVELHA